MGCVIVLTLGARDVMLEMQGEEKDSLAAALREEICGPAGPAIQVRLTVAGLPYDYSAAYVSSGHVVVYRPIERKELDALPDDLDASTGFVVHDILSGGSTLLPGRIRP